MQENQNWLDHIPPRILFIAGLVGGVLVLCTVGFFILLGMTLKGVSFGSAAKNIDTVAQNPQKPSDQPSNEPSYSKPADVSSADHVFGSQNAKVTLVEFSDYQCPFCKRFHENPEKIVNESGGKVRWVYRHFPLESIHPLALKSAEASECVASLRGNDAFWKFSKKVFEKQDTLSETMLADTAVAVGVNRAAFTSCLSSGKFADKVRANQADGEKSGISGTPATFVIAADGSYEIVPGAYPYDQLKAFVDRALQK